MVYGENHIPRRKPFLVIQNHLPETSPARRLNAESTFSASADRSPFKQVANGGFLWVSSHGVSIGVEI